MGDQKSFKPKSALLSEINTVIAIGIWVFVLFLPALSGDFLDWDDRPAILENIELRKFDLVGIFTTRNSGLYYPLTLVTFAIENALFGLNPFVFHLNNLILHMINTLLVYFILSRTFKAQMLGAAFGALIFGIHPIHVESVAWIVERKDVLSGFFFLMAFRYYATHVESRQRNTYWKSFTSFILGILSKPMVITFPVVALCFDFYLGRKITLRSVKEKVPFFVCSLLLGVEIAAFTHSNFYTEHPVTLGWRLTHAFDGLLFYLRSFVWPKELFVFYEDQFATSSMTEYLICSVLVAGFLGVVAKFKEQRRALCFGAAFFLVTIALVLQFVPLGPGTFQDRYLYLPSLGLILITLKIGEAWGVGKWRRWGLSLAAVLVLGWFSIRTWQQSKVWLNQETVSMHILKTHSTSQRSLQALGTYHARLGKFDQAAEFFSHLIKNQQADGLTYSNYGVVLSNLGKHQDAIESYKTGIRLNPNLYDLRVNLGHEYLLVGQYEEAERTLLSSLEVNPSGAMAYVNLGMLFYRRNLISQAQQYYKKAVELDPFVGLDEAGKALVGAGR